MQIKTSIRYFCRLTRWLQYNMLTTASVCEEEDQLGTLWAGPGRGPAAQGNSVAVSYKANTRSPCDLAVSTRCSNQRKENLQSHNCTRKFLAAKWLLMGDGMSKSQRIHTLEQHSAIKSNALLMLATPRKNLNSILLMGENPFSIRSQ